jgi:hypothetical protein
MPSDQSLIALAEQERARLINARMMTDGIPPLDIIPQATPVGALKNRTALQNQYSPEATNILEQTPVNLRFTQESALEGTGGFYNPTVNYLEEPRYLFTNNDVAGVPPGGINVESLLSSDSTLAHEFGHKWYDQKLSNAGKQAWAESDYRDQWAKDIGWMPEEKPWHYETELHAGNAQHGPYQMTAEERATHYPGLYRDNITQPQQQVAMESWQNWEPAQPSYAPDLASLRANYFGTQNWVPEQGVSGYNSHGMPIQNPRFGVPTVLPPWNPHIQDYPRGG